MIVALQGAEQSLMTAMSLHNGWFKQRPIPAGGTPSPTF